MAEFSPTPVATATSSPSPQASIDASVAAVLKSSKTVDAINEAAARAKASGALPVTTTSTATPSGALTGTKANAPVGWTPELVCKLSLGIGFFALLCLSLITLLLWRRGRNAEQILRTFGILIIVFAAVFLVIAGYSDSQITPVIGLLGTIAGYLLGRRVESAITDDSAEKSKESGKGAQSHI
jgi:hypothetical protein